MSVRWFRLYNDAIRNPKVAGLNDRDFRTWVSLLCIASENDGHIPPAETTKKLLSMRLDHLLAAFQRLSSIGLIDQLGDCYEPHNWSKFQYKSDTSTERVTLHRQRKKRKAVTPPETDTETEDIEPKGSRASGDALKPEHIFKKWNEVAERIGKSKVRDLTPSRAQLIRARIAQYSIADFQTVFAKVERSDFLREGRFCTFDWIMKRANFQKIIEGNYDD